MAYLDFKRYVWLIDLLNNFDGVAFEDIDDAWKDAKDLNPEGKPFPLKTFYNHLKAIRSIFDIDIKLSRKDGRYRVLNTEPVGIGRMQKSLMSMLSLRNTIDRYKGLSGRILYEEEPDVFPEWMRRILYAMNHGKQILLEYRKYGDTRTTSRTLEPYCLKLYNRRWYMLVKKADAPTATHDTAKKGDLFIFSLDRIESIELLQTKFTVDKNFDAATFFSDCFGIMVDDSKKSERIVLRAYGLEPYYLRDLPMHHSQKEIKRTDSYTDFEFKLRPAQDFIEHLLSLSTRVRVLEPAWLVKEMQQRLRDALNAYNEK